MMDLQERERFIIAGDVGDVGVSLTDEQMDFLYTMLDNVSSKACVHEWRVVIHEPQPYSRSLDGGAERFRCAHCGEKVVVEMRPSIFTEERWL